MTQGIRLSRRATHKKSFANKDLSQGLQVVGELQLSDIFRGVIVKNDRAGLDTHQQINIEKNHG